MTCCGGEPHARDMLRTYTKTLREHTLEYGGSLADARAPSCQELMISGQVSAYEAGDISRVTYLDEREE